MANVNRAAGFTPRRHLNGGVIALSRHHIASGLASNIFQGDAVIPVNTSKNINVAAAGNRILGVFDGVQYVNAAGEIKFEHYWATGTVPKTGTTPDAWVYDDPRILFLVQMSGAFALADIGAFADLTKGTAGSTLTGQSGDQIDSTTVGSGTVFKIYDYDRSPSNEIGTNAKVLVGAVLHYHDGAMTAI
jgi:hypothetical protein